MSLWAESSARIFARLHGVVEMGRFDLVDAVEYLINLQWRRESEQLEWRFSGSLRKIYPQRTQEWNVNRMDKTGAENL